MSSTTNEKPVSIRKKLPGSHVSKTANTSAARTRNTITITVPDALLANPAAVCRRIQQLEEELVCLRRHDAWVRKSRGIHGRPASKKLSGPNIIRIRVPSHLLVNPLAILRARILKNEGRIEALEQRL